MQKKSFLVFVIAFAALIGLSTQNQCVKALQEKKCEKIYSLFNRNSKSKLCRWHRIKFVNRCDYLITQEDSEPECTNDCRNLLLKLNKKFDNFLLCDCHNDMNCIWFKQRTFRCMNQTLKYKKNCDVERQRCEQNKTCYNLYANWFQKCQDMITGYKCTSECLLAEEELYSHSIGQSLKTCECAGSKDRDIFCRSVRMNRNKLCSNKHVNSVDNEYYNDVRNKPDIGKSNSNRWNGSAKVLQLNTLLYTTVLLQFYLMVN